MVSTGFLFVIWNLFYRISIEDVWFDFKREPASVQEIPLPLLAW